MPVEIGVVGAGVMGAEIALVAALAGHPVRLNDLDEERIAAGITHARTVAARLVRRGSVVESAAEDALARVSSAPRDEDLARCGLVVEAVTEQIDVKRAVFQRLDALLSPEAVLASNTSGLSITTLASFTGRPDRVIGLHFFNPPSVMGLVEVVRGEATSAETVAWSMDRVTGMGKTPVVVVECPGFLVNRILLRAMTAAYRRAAAGDVDHAAADAEVVRRGPAPMGPFALADLIGLDTTLHVQRDLQRAYGARFDDGDLLAPRVARGRLGRKSGGGFFDAPVTDPPPADAAAVAVADAYYEAARDEARRCIDEGVAAAADVDVAMRLGAGWRGGPDGA